jgi:hypothetical protein
LVVLTSTGAVAFGIVALLPVELVINIGSGSGFCHGFRAAAFRDHLQSGRMVPRPAGVALVARLWVSALRIPCSPPGMFSVRE